MRVLIDDQPLTTAPASIAGAIAAARLNAQQRGRVVIEAVLDGEPLSDAQLSDPPDAHSLGKELRFVTAEPAELVGSTLDGVAATLTDLKTEQSAAAELLILGRMSEAMDRLHLALRTWETVQQAVVDGTALLGISVDEVRIRIGEHERPMADQVRSLATCLTEVKRAFKAEDWSALADVLGYDLQEQADEWKESLIGLAGQVRGAGGGSAR